MQGYLIGNGVSGSQFEGLSALIPFTHGMGLVSDDIFEVRKSHFILFLPHLSLLTETINRVAKILLCTHTHIHTYIYIYIYKRLFIHCES